MHSPDSPIDGPHILVVGSLNLDHSWSVPVLPAPGHTVLANRTQLDFGGKGANQAVAAARQGAKVTLVGMVGDDDGGRRYQQHLQAEGVDPSGIMIAPVATGSAHIYVDPRGENMIVVNSGANAELDVPGVRAVLADRLAKMNAVLLQLESPLDVVQETLRLARQHGVRSILNASPCHPGFQWDTPIDTVIVNEHESGDFFGLVVGEPGWLSGEERSALLSRHKINHLIVTRGGDPTVLLSAEEELRVPAFSVVPKNTVGAGDAFAGALAARCAEGMTWRDAIWQANICAALSTLADGAQSSVPSRAEVRRVVDEKAASTRPEV